MKYLNFYDKFNEAKLKIMPVKNEFLELIGEYLLNDEFHQVCAELGCPAIYINNLEEKNCRNGYTNLVSTRFFSFFHNLEGNVKMFDKIGGGT